MIQKFYDVELGIIEMLQSSVFIPHIQDIRDSNASIMMDILQIFPGAEILHGQFYRIVFN